MKQHIERTVMFDSIIQCFWTFVVRCSMVLFSVVPLFKLIHADLSRSGNDARIFTLAITHVAAHFGVLAVVIEPMLRHAFGQIITPGEIMFRIISVCMIGIMLLRSSMEAWALTSIIGRFRRAQKTTSISDFDTVLVAMYISAPIYIDVWREYFKLQVDFARRYHMTSMDFRGVEEAARKL